MDCEISSESDPEQMKKRKKARDKEKQIVETFLSKDQESEYHLATEHPYCKRKMVVRFRLSAFRFILFLFLAFLSLSFSYALDLLMFFQNRGNQMNVGSCFYLILCHMAQQQLKISNPNINFRNDSIRIWP
jgi:hypothetical protein